VRRRVATAAVVSLCTVLALCAACGAIVGPDAPASPAALFDQVWNDFDLHYSLFVVKQVNWDSLRAVYRPLALAQDPESVSAVIAGMLSELQDDHVLWRGSRAGTTTHGDYFAPTVTFGKYVQYGGGLPGGISYGVVSPAVGYIAFSTFEGNGWLSSVDSAIALLGGVSAIIIDVRNNGGGFLENATGAAGRFADRTTTVAYVRYRNGPAHTDFAAPMAQQVAPTGTHRFAGKVYLLTSRNTISAAELFVLSMRALGNTTVVGDTTAGETGNPFARELQNGWSYQFPESLELTLDGHWFEDIGLPPDVTVENSIDEINKQNVDAQLARAIALAAANP
jgi:C-terminal processing protease CtpA/Prc